VEWSGVVIDDDDEQGDDQTSARARGIPPLACLSGARGGPTQRGTGRRGDGWSRWNGRKAVDLCLGLCVRFFKHAMQWRPFGLRLLVGPDWEALIIWRLLSPHVAGGCVQFQNVTRTKNYTPIGREAAVGGGEVPAMIEHGGRPGVQSSGRGTVVSPAV
jgi:hypothetical protein